MLQYGEVLKTGNIMARKTRIIPQKSLAPADRETFDTMIETIRPQVGVFINKQPYNFILDTRILTDVQRFPVTRPKTQATTWGGYFAYTPTYAALSPEQRWNYLEWLTGNEQLAIQMFRIMRLHALCCEFGGPRRQEAIKALRQLYQTSQTDTVSASMIGNILSLAYAAEQPRQLSAWLKLFQPTSAMPVQLQAYIYGRSNNEAPGQVLLELATQSQFRFARGMGGRRDQIVSTLEEIAAQWGQDQNTTIINTVLEQTSFMPLVFAYNDTLMMWVCRTLDIPQGSLQLETSDVAPLLNALATAAQEHVRSRRKGNETIDGLQLLEGILQGDSTVVQFDLSGTTSYSMTKAEADQLQTMLETVQDIPGVVIYQNEWDIYSYWDQGTSANQIDTAVFRNLPIKKPTSAQPLPVPSPPTYSTASYRTMTPEQRWWYLAWLAGATVEPLPVFLISRFKALEAVIYGYSKREWLAAGKRWHSGAPDQPPTVFNLIEDLTARSDNETLMRHAAAILMPLYAMYGAAEQATQLFERVAFNIDQGPEMVEYLWEAGGNLSGAGLLNIARAGGFNHTPLTKECFEQIAAKAGELLKEWEETYGPLTDVPITSFGNRRSRRTKSALSIAADIAREAQEYIKVERRRAPRSKRMSAEELAAEQSEIAGLPTNAGDDPSERIYHQLACEPLLLSTYLAHGVQALEAEDPALAVAFLRRAHELDHHGPALKLLALARAQLVTWQQMQREEAHG